MKTFEIRIDHTKEVLPTIKRKGSLFKHKKNANERFQKKHQIEDYQNYLGVFALPLITERESAPIKKQKITNKTINLLPMPRQNFPKSHSGVAGNMKKLDEFLFSKQRESARFNNKIYRIYQKYIPYQSIPDHEDSPSLPILDTTENLALENEHIRNPEASEYEYMEFIYPVKPIVQVIRYSYN